MSTVVDNFTSPSRRLALPPRTPTRNSADRFIPGSANRESLVLGRHVDRLTRREKLTRTLSAGPDPFSSTIPRTPIAQRSGSGPSSTGSSSSPRSPGFIGLRRSSLTLTTTARRLSQGAVWSIGGSVALGDSVAGVSNGRGGLLASGTNAPLYSSNFLSRRDSAAELDVHERRLAVALDLDTASRVFQYSTPAGISGADSGYSSSPERRTPQDLMRRVWRDSAWETPGATNILDAPSLRDDYYCSLLAYSPTTQSLAVGLGSHVYLWTESRTTATPESLRTSHTAHVTSLAFSSPTGNKGILAVGRADGRILLWSPIEEEARWDAMQPSSVCCVSFRSQPVKRQSIRDSYIEVDTEELLIGDEAGHLYYYSIEWPTEDEKDIWDWPGAMSLLLRITAHSQQICGLAWSPDGEWFAAGGNDNICHLFESKEVLQRAKAGGKSISQGVSFNFGSSNRVDMSSDAFTLDESMARQSWTLQAAVKAIAFCPWQRGLLAIGGGSNDRCIHFYHTISGACIATIDCCAQVTSLIWSNTRREIAATFGFAQPEHPYRIAVFEWPSCRQIVAIPWYDEHRALYAIPYPGGPNMGHAKGEGGVWWSRTQEEGCIVVATSDCSIKFHEVWAEEKKATASKGGLLGGSDILESLHGIDKVGMEVIR